VADFTMIERTGLALATVMARKGADHAAILTAADCAMIPTGPGTWLAEGDAELLAVRLVGLAHVSDQSGGYIVHRFAGPAARALLQKGVAIDLDPSAFGPGSAAVTGIAHIGVIIWQVDDAPTYDLALFRSFAGSFHHWVAAAAQGLRD
jgi:sarcosine oxidase subunit gamma